MGLTYITATIINPGSPKRRPRLQFLVDSGAIYTVAPGAVLRRLGIRPRSSRVFTLADGTQITRRIGDAICVIDGEQAASPVIFGEKGDTALFGTVSLETLGFVLDSMTRQLRPLPLVLG